MSRLKIYNNSTLSDSEVLLICSGLMINPDLQSGEFQHPKRITIRCSIEGLGFKVFHINEASQ